MHGSWLVKTLSTAVASVCAVALASPASADELSAYADWTLEGKAGTVAVPAAGFPLGKFTTDSGRTSIPSGNSTFLNEATPFGKEFGGSKGQGYLMFGAASTGPSTTEIKFNHGTPAGRWGFALGDIDADSVTVEAFDADGNKLTAAQLGWRGAFNYCQDAPRPSSCSSNDYTDKPVWEPGAAVLRGNVVDTQGAAGWFMPTVPVKTLRLVFAVQAGIPIGQLWIASKWTEGKPDPVPDVVPGPPKVEHVDPDVRFNKSARPTAVRPGDKITYRIEVANVGKDDEPNAVFSDDLSDVLDDARFLNDVDADGGRFVYQKPILTWKGSVKAGQTRTITYSVRVDDPVGGDRKIRNVLLAEGHHAEDEPRASEVVTVKLKKAGDKKKSGKKKN